MQSDLKNQHTAEVSNLAAVNDRKHYNFDASLLEWEQTGDFWGLLDSLGISLAVSREYEHFIMLLSGCGGQPLQSPLPLPHPSGICFDHKNKELIVSSTRTPNIIFWMKKLDSSAWSGEIVPVDMERCDGDLFLPYRSSLLPGSLYIHEIGLIGEDLYATITGHNFVAKLNKLGGWERVWWPLPVEAAGSDSFRTNFFQLNGMACGSSLAESYFTAFCDSIAGAKPWKQGFGPREKGVVFSGKSREVVCRGLTCPHSVRFEGRELLVCNSGFGEIVRVRPDDVKGQGTIETVARLPGFTRGLALHDDYIFVGLSRVIDSYEAYAPGVKPESSKCAIGVVNRKTGDVTAMLSWPAGYQIFDVQVLPNMKRTWLPMPQAQGEQNDLLRYLG